MINQAVGCKSLDHQSAKLHLYGRSAKLDEDTGGLCETVAMSLEI